MKANSKVAKPRAKNAPAGLDAGVEAKANGQLLTSKENLEERLRFETLLSEISARFVNLPANLIGSDIEDAQRRICELLDLDRSTLWQVCEEEPGSPLLLTNWHISSGSLAIPERMCAGDFFPWTSQKVMAGETVVISKLTDLPPEAGRDLQSFRLYDTKSTVSVPLSVGEGPVFGLLGFAVMREEKSWTETVVMGFELIAQIFANALARKRADEALRESEARYRGIFEGAIEGIYRVSLEGKLLFANPAMAKILGYDSAEDFLRSVTDVGSQVWANPEDRARGIQKIEKEGVLRGYECLFRCKDGTPVWVSLNTSLVRGPDGKIAYFDGFVENIDERRRTRETLETSEHFLAETARIGKVGGWEFDVDTGKQTWTAETYNIHEVDPGYKPTVEKGFAFFTPASRPIIEKAVRRAMEQGAPYELELEIVTAKGHHRDVRTIGRADPAHRRVYGFIQDISARKQNERDMAELRLEWNHLTRVLTVNELSASLAHEINQPLGAILNNAEAARILLTQAGDKRQAFSEIIDDIIEDARRAGDVIRKVRSVVKKSNAQFEPVPVNTLIDESLDILQNNLALNNVTLQLDLKPDLADVKGDRVRLQQVLLNLVTNALEAMKETPSRILTVRSAMDVPDVVTVSVSDSGAGIAEARRALLFRPFYTTKRNGLGLGLSICKSIIDEHGGQIWVDNNPGGGATFSFSLKAWREGSA